MDHGGQRRPRVVLLTGEPGSGKTVLGTVLSRTLGVPFLARDQVRRGLLLTAGAWAEAVRRVPPPEQAVAAFLDVIITFATALSPGPARG